MACRLKVQGGGSVGGNEELPCEYGSAVATQNLDPGRIRSITILVNQKASGKM
jgi:hypothetical protein